MGDISEHFDRREFRCKCGCGYDTVDVELLELCEIVRQETGKPLIINSACRCPSHNREVGGGKRSQHLIGRAADLRVDNPKAVYDALCKRFPDEYGFGCYDTFVHVDSRTNGPARW
jgi:uncharacterized protein YcbK (DUF882 family)